MLRPFAVDVARTLPAEAGLVNPAPQCAGTDHDTLCVQMFSQQWYGPGVGVIPELARVAREQLTELGIRQKAYPVGSGHPHMWCEACKRVLARPLDMVGT